MVAVSASGLHAARHGATSLCSASQPNMRGPISRLENHLRTCCDVVVHDQKEHNQDTQPALQGQYANMGESGNKLLLSLPTG